MSTRHSLPLLGTALLALAVVASSSRAGTLGLIAVVGGPGGVGAGSAVTVVPNNDNAGGVNPNVGTITAVFSAVAPIDAVFTVAPSGGTTEYFFGNLSVNNDTGFTWTDFHFELIPGNVAGLDFDTPDADPTPTSTAFTVLSHLPTTIDWSGGAVPSPGVVGFTFSLDVPDGVSQVTIRLIPTVTAAVPEPASLTLLGLGALGLAGYVRRRRAA